MGLIILLIILIGIIACVITYVVWIIRSIMRKRFRMLAGLMLVPVLLLACLTAGMRVYSGYRHKEYLKNVFSVSTDLGTPLFEYDSPRSFNGDGYSFSVYVLPSSVEARFSSPVPALTERFPVRPGYRDHWKTVLWQSTPFPSDYEMYLQFTLSSYDRDNQQELQKHFDKTREALSMQGNYFAFFHYDHGDHPGNIDFFLIDLIRKKLYIINHNT
jgi:hypothetical protein